MDVHSVWLEKHKFVFGQVFIVGASDRLRYDQVCLFLKCSSHKKGRLSGWTPSLSCFWQKWNCTGLWCCFWQRWSSPGTWASYQLESFQLCQHSAALGNLICRTCFWTLNGLVFRAAGITIIWGWTAVWCDLNWAVFWKYGQCFSRSWKNKLFIRYIDLISGQVW